MKYRCPYCGTEYCWICDPCCSKCGNKAKIVKYNKDKDAHLMKRNTEGS